MYKRKAKKKKGGRVWRTIGVVVLILVLFAAGTIAGIVSAYAQNLPDISRMADYQPSRTTHIYARDGTLLGTLYKENRVWIPISRVPPIVRDAFIATEDRNLDRKSVV